MKAALLGAALGAVLAALVAASAASGAGGPTVRATVSPTTVGLGDPFRLTIDADAPAGAGDLRVLVNTGVFVEVAAPRTSRSGGHVRVVETLVCLDRGCAPNAKPRRVALPAPRATVGGRTVTGAAPVVEIVPRVPASAVAASRARYRAQTAVPRPSSRLPLGATAAGALALAGLLAAAGVLTIVVELRRKRGSTTPEWWPAGGLALALRLLRESAERTTPDRRRAADLVARVAALEVSPNVAGTATRVAWAPPEPQPDDVEALAEEVEHAFRSAR